MADDANRMRGDAIGNTLYSECWVIKILMKLTKFSSEDWSEDMETELCLLWDMTIEPDVVELLMQHNFLDLTSRIIHHTNIPRLMEILVGIIGNLTCVPRVRKEIARKVDIIRMLLELLSMPDVPTLLQLMRLLQACFWDLRNTEENTVSSGPSVEKSVLRENNSKNPSIHEAVTKCSELDINSSFKVTVDEEARVADVQEVKRAGNLREEKSVHRPSGEILDLQNCAMDLDLSGANRCTLHESSHKETVESLVLEADQVDCEIKDASYKSKDEQLQIKVDVNKEKAEVDSVWLQELSDVNKWFPSIIFILGSSTNGELICSTLALLDTLCHVPISDGYLGRHIASPDVVLALLETLKQLHHEYRKDNDFCKDVKLEKAVRHWAAILSGFSSFPEGKAALCNHAEALSTSLCSHLMVDKLSDQLSEHQAEFIMLATEIMGSLLEDSGYFHPPTFNRFLSILTFLRGRSTLERNRCNRDGGENLRNVFATWEVQQEVIGVLEKYFVAVVQRADGGALASVLQHCNKEHVAILQSVMEGQKSI
ncbi:uncharacterized protein LOC110834446 isoform X2 [Zootermopsis nevadensis]|nr:uncharacterized protein LOC110834446 isoform X2 [Zootermopsis nevadensis]XP_021929303.1 uncharacterized protein LOC110834446 isoform X2 [Zootermopsis nevadensis]XP_021929304.1 uncharacterized protein LOC110834446 isoform X2 [Zootermopsis nevadensis]XP_021929305.1 uncharacterized protein LOC110834446 isoform X2 [Zootermopsis nevadensis]